MVDFKAGKTILDAAINSIENENIKQTELF